MWQKSSDDRLDLGIDSCLKQLMDGLPVVSLSAEMTEEQRNLVTGARTWLAVSVVARL